MSKLTFIGDTHGAWMHLNKSINKANRKFQPELIVHVGDVGFGWHKKDPERRFVETFRFLRGNHDRPDWCRAHPSYLGDYGYLDKYKLFYMSGAESMLRMTPPLVFTSTLLMALYTLTAKVPIVPLMPYR